MNRRVWALRVIAVVIAGGGSLLSSAVYDEGARAASIALAITAVTVGMFLAHLSTKIKASPRPADGKRRGERP